MGKNGFVILVPLANSTHSVKQSKLSMSYHKMRSHTTHEDAHSSCASEFVKKSWSMRVL